MQGTKWAAVAVGSAVLVSGGLYLKSRFLGPAVPVLTPDLRHSPQRTLTRFASNS